MIDDIDKAILNTYQNAFPVSTRPFLTIANDLGLDETLVIERIKKMKDLGVITRLGAVFRPHKVGVSTLCAMSVPHKRLNDVVSIVNHSDSVNHNYLRKHYYNLWFVLTCRDNLHLKEVIEELESKTSCSILDLRMVKSYHINLGFFLD